MLNMLNESITSPVTALVWERMATRAQIECLERRIAHVIADESRAELDRAKAVLELRITVAQIQAKWCMRLPALLERCSP